jgi:hypothetical protein
MSKADISTTLIRSRRAVLAGIAAGGVVAAASPALSAAAAIPDPIFAAIDAFRRADAEFMAHEGPEDILVELGGRHWDAYDAALRTRPTTMAGLVALTTLARERADWLRTNGTEGGDDFCTVSATIDDATRGMSGLEPCSPPLAATVEGGAA